MKKLLFGFALVAMILVAGCKNGDSWGDVDKKIKADEIKLTDGNWVYEYSYSAERTVSDWKGSIYDIEYSSIKGRLEEDFERVINFTVSNGKVTVTKNASSQTLKFPSDVDTSKIEAGVNKRKANGNTDYEYTVSGSTVKYKYNASEKNLAKDIPTDDFISNYLGISYDLYSNEDGTKYRHYNKWSDGVEESESEETLVKD